MANEKIDVVELTKALMNVLEFGKDNDGQIVFYSNCYESFRGIEEFLDR